MTEKIKMIDEKTKKRLNLSVTSLMNKYDMFFTNRQYASEHFQTEEEFVSIQKSLAKEIQIEEATTREIIKKYFKENFPEIEIMVYDSRSICITEIYHRVGAVLIKGLPENENKIQKIEKEFSIDTDLTISISRWEDLNEETQNKLMEFLK